MVENTMMTASPAPKSTGKRKAMCMVLQFEKERLILRLLVVTVLVSIYFIIDWTVLRSVLRSTVILILGLLGLTAAPINVGDELFLRMNSGAAFAVTANCTYMDLLLMMVPFWWRFQRSLGANAMRLLILTTILLALNIIRVALALFLFGRGLPWEVVHDVPDVALHCIGVAVSVWLSFENRVTSAQPA